MRLPSRPRGLLLAVALIAAAGAGARLDAQASAAVPPADTVLLVPASSCAGTPVAYPARLAAGDRLALRVEGGVRGFRPDSAGGIPQRALVASFAGGPPFLLGPGRPLLWTAPSAGILELWVAAGRERASGAYRVAATALGPRGDARQRRFPPPRIAFLPREPGGPLLELRYQDRSGFGLDPRTLKAFLDTAGGERFVLTPYLRTGPDGARLEALPPAVRPPPGVHRVAAEIGDALGNVSAPAEVFLDLP